MSAPEISVIVPVYKVEAYLDRCVESILVQTFVDFELILVDDGSPDRCGDICEAWARKDARVRVIHQQNRGLSGARNAGLDICRGAYIAFVDSDDEVTADYLSTLRALFEGRPRCALTACNHTIARGGKKSPGVAMPEGVYVYTRREAFSEALWHGAVDVSAWAKMYRQSVFDGLRYPEGQLFEDTWLFGDVLLHTEEVVVSSRQCYIYNIRGDSITSNAFSRKNLMYIEAAEKLSSQAVSEDPALSEAAARRVNHARLSVLRYMEHCPEVFRPLRAKLRQEILQDAGIYIRNERTPGRDRMAIRLLRPGLWAFYAGWRAYTWLR